MAVPFGGLLAHLILIPSWTLPPFMLLGSLVLCGWHLGLMGVLASLALLMLVVGGPRGVGFRSAIAAASFGLALTAPEADGVRARALGGAAATVVMVALVTCGRFAPSPAFFRLISETLDGRTYYASTALRGALDELGALKRPCFVLVHPHGCLSIGWTWNLFWNSTFHALTGRINFLIDDGLRHKNPFFRVVCDWYEAPSRSVGAADRATIRRAMAAGESLALIPGGFEDATIMVRGRERTAMSKRKGVVKYALEAGYPLVPVYTFGESDSYHCFEGLLAPRLWLNKFGVPACVFFGNPLVPPLPRTDVPILTVVGKPLALPRIAAPTAADVAEWHAKYVAALVELFDEHKKAAGKPDATLEVW
jgi:hypothetical protein